MANPIAVPVSPSDAAALADAAANLAAVSREAPGAAQSLDELRQAVAAAGTTSAAQIAAAARRAFGPAQAPAAQAAQAPLSVVVLNWPPGLGGRGRGSLPPGSPLGGAVPVPGTSAAGAPAAAGLAQTGQQTERLISAMERFGAASSSAFGQASAGILSLLSAANPLVSGTFRASVEGVAIATGQAFAPAVLQASGYLQQLGDYIQGLDPDLKRNVGSMAVWGTAVLGGAFAVTRLVAGLRLLGGVVTLGLTANPWVLGITGLATAVGALGAAWYATREQAEGATRAMGEAGRVGVSGGPGGGGEAPRPLTDEQRRGLPPEVQRRLAEAGADQPRVLRELQDYQARAEREAEQARRLRAEAVGADAADRAREEADARRALPAAREVYNRRIREITGVNVGVPGRAVPGFREPTETERRQTAEEAAELAFPRPDNRYAVVTPEIRAQRERLVLSLLGRPGDAAAAPTGRAREAENRVTAAERALRNVTELLAGLGAAGRARLPDDPRLALSGVLPQSRSFSDPAAYGEFLQERALQPTGSQEVKNAIDRMLNVLSTLGEAQRDLLLNIRDNTGRLDRIGEAMGW